MSTTLDLIQFVDMVAKLTESDGLWHDIEITCKAKRSKRDVVFVDDIEVKSDGVVIHSHKVPAVVGSLTPG